MELQEEGAGTDDGREEAFGSMAFEGARAGDGSRVGFLVGKAGVFDEQSSVGNVVKREAGSVRREASFFQLELGPGVTISCFA